MNQISKGNAMKSIIFVILISCGCYSQNQTANQKLQPLSGDVNLPEEKSKSMPNATQMKLLQEAGKKEREAYKKFQDSAQVAFKQNDFTTCIYLYEKARGINQFLSDASFMYIAAVSYYNVSVQLDDKKYRQQAKQLLKQADNRGYVDARIFLNENF